MSPVQSQGVHHANLLTVWLEDATTCANESCSKTTAYGMDVKAEKLQEPMPPHGAGP